MNKRIFVDTGAWIALTNAADQYHATAAQYWKTLHVSGTKLMTSNFVLDETYTRLRFKAGLQITLRFGEQIRSSQRLQIITVEVQMEKIAWEIFRKYADQRFSYTDCTSFAVMRAKKISEVFAFDTDFHIMGFQVVPPLAT